MIDLSEIQGDLTHMLTSTCVEEQPGQPNGNKKFQFSLSMAYDVPTGYISVDVGHSGSTSIYWGNFSPLEKVSNGAGRGLGTTAHLQAVQGLRQIIERSGADPSAYTCYQDPEDMDRRMFAHLEKIGLPTGVDIPFLEYERKVAEYHRAITERNKMQSSPT